MEGESLRVLWKVIYILFIYLLRNLVLFTDDFTFHFLTHYLISVTKMTKLAIQCRKPKMSLLNQHHNDPQQKSPRWWSVQYHTAELQKTLLRHDCQEPQDTGRKQTMWWKPQSQWPPPQQKSFEQTDLLDDQHVSLLVRFSPDLPASDSNIECKLIPSDIILSSCRHICHHIVTLSRLKTKENSWRFSKDALSMVIYHYTLSIRKKQERTILSLSFLKTITNQAVHPSVIFVEHLLKSHGHLINFVEYSLKSHGHLVNFVECLLKSRGHLVILLNIYWNPADI